MVLALAKACPFWFGTGHMYTLSGTPVNGGLNGLPIRHGPNPPERSEASLFHTLAQMARHRSCGSKALRAQGKATHLLCFFSSS